MKLQGKKAILTGGSQGLGKEIVKAFLKEGACVSFCSRNKKELKQTYNELLKYVKEGQLLTFFQADVGKY